MASPFRLQDSWAGGMKRDFPRDDMPPDSAWNLVDYLPQTLGAPLRKRGGYSYASNDISATKATASYVLSVVYAEFAAASKLVVHDEDGELYTLTPGSLTVTDVGASLVVTQNPVLHRDKLVITDGSSAPKKYDGSTIAALGATAPSGVKYATVYKDRTVLARTSANPNRVYFSDAGDPTTYDTTNAFIDVSHPVTGLASLASALLVFSSGRVERIRGSVPPPGTDMVLEPLFDVGVVDPWSIANVDDQVVFANPQGIYATDGATLADLTQLAGMKTYWQELLSSFGSTTVIAGGVYRGHYIAVVHNGATFADCIVCHVASRVMWRFANIKARAFARQIGASEELYFGLRSAARLGKLSPVFSPSSSVRADADSTAVAPVVETPFYLRSGGKKSWRWLYLTYELDDASAENPTLALSYIPTPSSIGDSVLCSETTLCSESTLVSSADEYTALSPSFTELSDITRVRHALRFASNGIALKLAQSNASGDTRIHELEADAHGREPSRL